MTKARAQIATRDEMFTVTQLAEKMGMPRPTTRDLVKRLRAEDRAVSAPTDWYQPARGRGSRALVNLARLKRAHPAVFRTEVEPKDYEKLVERVETLEAKLRDERALGRARGARLRDVNGALASQRDLIADLQKRMTHLEKSHAQSANSENSHGHDYVAPPAPSRIALKAG